MHWLHIHYHSETLGMPVQMEVLLPEPSGETIQKYPTLYLLHDIGDSNTAWLRKTNIESYAEELSLAIVMPVGHQSYYTDMFYGKAYFTHVTEELPAICERMFPLSTVRENRFIAGNGIGGYGALKAGLSASHNFSISASFSSPIDINGIADRMDKVNPVDIFGRSPDLIGSNHDLYAIADVATQTHFYLACELESEFFQENLLFTEHLKGLGLPPTMIKTEVMENRWKRLDLSVEKFVKWLSDTCNSTIGRKEE
ncbi:alpha/beta hydrolase [Gracilibacillus xinjiangensis]|uniref:Alpha/beta hydrolase n=1 Tax=Gracilibacillus xinjiangensis TaxID=1193282 RepID=A0ABV8WR38_9BACI